ncbi:MAG: 3-phosphoglycerate dehydrogenase family protein [Oscillospiraceae bacterium]|nr:3-phosphoglycerate dehydrogenase family protein [Oscillospiraceae bacterium]
MYNIRLLNKISPSGLERLPAGLYAYGEDIAEPDAILIRSASMHETELPASLKAIARCGAGVNNIPVDKCTQSGIVVFNTPGANANAVKELTMAGLLLSARKIAPGMKWVQELKGKGADVPGLVEKGKGKFGGPELRGKKLGVVGLGAIGAMVCNFARHFGMEVYGYDPYLSVQSALKLSRDIKYADTLKVIYDNCDFISLHVPYTPDTKGMVNEASINQMKHGVRILNFSRAELVDDADMLAALDEKKVYCYITDFPNDAVLGHPGVIALPHLGASTPESEDNCAVMAADEIRDFLENGNIVNSVNFPDVHAPRTGAVRVGVIHKNRKGVIAKITGAVGANIDNLTNKSRGDYAYTLLDMDDDVSTEAIEKLGATDGVIRVSVIR